MANWRRLLPLACFCMLVVLSRANVWNTVRTVVLGRDESSLDATACVRTAEYFADYNIMGVGDKHKPWPVADDGTATETLTICPNMTWLDVVKSADGDQWTLTTKRLIAARLNVLRGAVMSADLFTSWESAWNRVSACCNKTCNMSDFDAITLVFREYNLGNSGPPACTDPEVVVPEPVDVVPEPTDVVPEPAPQADAGSGCVRSKQYWAANNRDTNGVSWPSNSETGAALEDSKFCPRGARWVEIMVSDASNDPIMALAQEVVAFNLNRLTGATFTPAAYALWETSYQAIVSCCFDNKYCMVGTMPDFAARLAHINEGRAGIPICPSVGIADPSECTCATVCPEGCDCMCNVSEVTHRCGCTCACVGCVLSAEWWSANNRNTGKPWPSNPDDPEVALEDRRFCENGPTWVEIMTAPVPPTESLRKQLIAALLNAANGASLSQTLRVKWEAAVQLVTLECSGTAVDENQKALATQTFLEYNTGKYGVPACRVPPADTCDCTCNLRCAEGCDCVCQLGADGLCACRCLCPPPPPSDCPCTATCPVAADCLCRGGISQCTVRGCVRPWRYWAENNRFVNNRPWPMDPKSNLASEDVRFCLKGPTYWEIMTSQVADNTYLGLQRELIAAWLNVLSGVSVSPDLFAMWQTAVSRVAECCETRVADELIPTGCDFTPYPAWRSQFNDLNEGRLGVPPCGFQAHCPACPDGCNCVCTLNAVGFEECFCSCAPGDCTCTEPCPDGCECVVHTDVSGVCRAACNCGAPIDCACALDCPPGCQPNAFVDQNGVCVSECVCPPSHECTCNRPCPAGTTCHCARDATGCCKCECGSVNVTVSLDCPAGCAHTVGVDGRPFCQCPVPDRCELPACAAGCAIQCTDLDGLCTCTSVCPLPAGCPACAPDCSVVCVNDACQCHCAPPPAPLDTLCPCNRPCPAGAVCSCARVDGCCQCECLVDTAATVPDVVCEVGCDRQCSMVDGAMVCTCVCPPPPDCTECPSPCPDGFTCHCQSVDGACACECVAPPDLMCTCTTLCPKGCICSPFIDAAGACQQRCLCEGCVRDASYWAANHLGVGAPWPGDGTTLGLPGVQGMPLEELRFCPTCPTWLEILKTPSTDAESMLAKQVIAARLNTLSGASLGVEGQLVWAAAFGELSRCGTGAMCDRSNFAVWEVAIKDYNEGRVGIPTCAPQCPCTVTCDAACQRICTTDINGVCNCYCQCPPPADCQCGIECAEGCTCVTWVDAAGVCQSRCDCPPPADCQCGLLCPAGCQCIAYIDGMGVCCSRCECPPPLECKCDITCPEGCTPVAEIVDGVCVKKCVCVPPPDCQCQIACPEGCECVSFADQEGRCQSYCKCPPPPTCVCDIECADTCTCVCHVDENGVCVSECQCPPPVTPPDCVCNIPCPSECECICVPTATGTCDCHTQCPPPPDCECQITCPEGCTCPSWLDSNGRCQSYCDCPPPEDCTCDVVCGEGCECLCKSVDGKCVCECKCPPPPDCECNIECPDVCECVCNRTGGVCHCACECEGAPSAGQCVHDVEYWATHSSETDNPWPMNPDGPMPYEQKKVCPTGDMWLDIMKQTHPDEMSSASQEIIASYLNIRNGVMVTDKTWKFWAHCYDELTQCCFNPHCNIELLTTCKNTGLQFNSGRGDVHPCVDP